MEKIPEKNFSVAWFKLAEFVARGEKERALEIFRLLSHSIENKAFVAQLKGDILSVFDYEAARKEYEKAALEYRKNNDLFLAAVLCDKIKD